MSVDRRHLPAARIEIRASLVHCYRLGPQRVDASTALMADLKALLGAGSVGFGR